MKKTKFLKRFAAMFIILFIFGAMFMPLASAASNEWVLVDVKVIATSGWDGGAVREQPLPYTYNTSSGGVITFEGTRNSLNITRVESGRYIRTTTASISSPPSKLNPGQKFSLSASISHSANYDVSSGGYGYISSGNLGYQHFTRSDYVNDGSMSSPYGFGYIMTSLEPGKFSDSASGSFNIKAPEKPLRGWEDEECSFVVTLYNDIDFIEIIYYYEWGGTPMEGIGKTDNTNAATTPGEVVIGVIAGALAVAAAAGAAGAAGGTTGRTTRDEEEQKKSTYRMTLRKDFGDAIKIDGETVTIYAAMEEILPGGGVLDRPDMAEKISIFTSCKNLSLDAAGMTDVYQTAHVRAGSLGADGDETEAVISFRLGDGENYYQNNVKFRLVGKPWLRFDSKSLYTLGASGKEYTLPFVPEDFIRPPTEYEFVMLTDGGPFTLEKKTDEDGKHYISATDTLPEAPKHPEEFIKKYNCVIKVRNDTEQAEEVFQVGVCFEGLIPVFGQGEGVRKIYGYRDESSEEMKRTLVDVQVGVWNEEKGQLDFFAPEDIKLQCCEYGAEYDAKKDIVKAIGLAWQYERNTGDAAEFAFQAKKPYPNNAEIKGLMSLSATYNDVEYENAVDFNLVPDLQEYGKMRDEEIAACKRVVRDYIPDTGSKEAGEYNIASWTQHLGGAGGRFNVGKATDMRLELYKQIDELRGNELFTAADFRLFRQGLIRRVTTLVNQQKADYMASEAYFEECIAYLELAKAIGEAALSYVLVACKVPALTSFVATYAKDAFLDFYEFCVYNKSPLTDWDHAMEYLWNRFGQLTGGADNLVDIEDLMKNPRKFILFVVGFYLYRVIWRKVFDRNEDGTMKGWDECLYDALVTDLGTLAMGILISKYVKMQGGSDPKLGTYEQKFEDMQKANSARFNEICDEIVKAFRQQIGLA